MSQPLPYHEPQRWRHCAKHALNALLEGHAELFAAAELYAAGRALPDAIGAGPLTNPHFSFFGGDFDVEVLAACARERGYALDWHDRRKPVSAALVAGEGTASRGHIGFLLNARRRRLFGAWMSRHWYALRPPGEGAPPGAPWHRVDSREAAPVPRSAAEVAEDLRALLATADGNVLVLRPLPASSDVAEVGQEKKEQEEEEGKEEEEEEEEDNVSKKTSSQKKKVSSMRCHHRLAVACFLGVACRDCSDASNAFDWSPSVSLTENFGVDEGLCIDIVGFGANLNCNGLLQLHTCKERGDDTQFFFDVEAREIRAVNYNRRCDEIPDDVAEQDACVTIVWPTARRAVGNLRLAECIGSEDQEFEYSGTDGTIRPTINLDLCLAKTSDVGPAGSNERTDFTLAKCQMMDASNIAWTVVPSPVTDGPAALISEHPSASPTTVMPSGHGSSIGLDEDKEEDSTSQDPSISPTNASASGSSELPANKIDPIKFPTLRPTTSTVSLGSTNDYYTKSLTAYVSVH